MAFPHRLPRAELDWQVPPRRTRAIPPRDALQRPPMIRPRASHTTLRGRQQRLHNSPDLVREHPITHHSKIITDDLIQNWQTRSSRPRTSSVVLRRLTTPPDRWSAPGPGRPPDHQAAWRVTWGLQPARV